MLERKWVEIDMNKDIDNKNNLYNKYYDKNG